MATGTQTPSVHVTLFIVRLSMTTLIPVLTPERSSASQSAYYSILESGTLPPGALQGSEKCRGEEFKVQHVVVSPVCGPEQQCNRYDMETKGGGLMHRTIKRCGEDLKETQSEKTAEDQTCRNVRLSCVTRADSHHILKEFNFLSLL